MRNVKPLSERLREAQAKLDEIPDAVSESFSEQFAASFGEIELHHPDAPDKMEYMTDELGDEWYQAWLVDAHEWALEEYHDALSALHEAVEPFEEAEYPELGLHRPSDEEQREAVRDAVVGVVEVHERLSTAVERLELIEESYKEQ